MRKLSHLLTMLVVFACADDLTTSPAVGALSNEALQNETGVKPDADRSVFFFKHCSQSWLW